MRFGKGWWRLFKVCLFIKDMGLGMEITMEYRHQHAPAPVVKLCPESINGLPFYEPEWKKSDQGAAISNQRYLWMNGSFILVLSKVSEFLSVLQNGPLNRG